MSCDCWWPHTVPVVHFFIICILRNVNSSNKHLWILLADYAIDNIKISSSAKHCLYTLTCVWAPNIDVKTESDKNSFLSEEMVLNSLVDEFIIHPFSSYSLCRDSGIALAFICFLLTVTAWHIEGSTFLLRCHLTCCSQASSKVPMAVTAWRLSCWVSMELLQGPPSSL